MRNEQLVVEDRILKTHIRRSEARARRDGDFSPIERMRIQREQNRTSRGIFRQRHDRQYWR
ncbi:MAG: hypothetical protein EXQ58_13960 [Acidobacteria bacterium]|nr:hypothetical protein [Acidobacteriota bacterium]